MRPSAALVLLLLPIAVANSKCNYVTLVRCFINILDEWAWTLYELKDNVVTITQDQCRHLRELDKCIKDDIGEKHTCSHSEVVEVSNTVSDLLTHRKNSGSFLKSYYLLTYACSTEGQEVLLNHRECLRNEKIGEMTLSAGTYLAEKFIKDSEDEDVCDLLNGKLKEYMQSMQGLCKNEASQIMCMSLKNMFKGLHADKLDECDLECPIENDAPSDEPRANEEEEVVKGASDESDDDSSTEVPVEVPNTPEGQKGSKPDSATSLTIISSLIPLVAALRA